MVTVPQRIDEKAAAEQRAVGRFAEDVVIPPADRGREDTGYVWRIVFLIYPSIDMDQTVSGVTTHFTYTLSQAEINEARQAMDGAVTGIFTGSNGEAKPVVTTVIVGRTLTSLAKFGADVYWPDCSITAPELLVYGMGRNDSAVVYWPAWNHGTGAHINNPYWGLSYGSPAGWTYNVGYSTVSNVTSPVVGGYYPGEVIVHEWLHPTTDFYHTAKGYTVPNLDGAGNYRPCPACANYAYVSGDGWMPFYRDIMRGTVWDPATSTWMGVPPAAWRSGTPTNTQTAAEGWQLYE